MIWKPWMVVAMVLALGGCASRGVRPQATPQLTDPAAIAAAQARQATREAWLGEWPQWQFQGRVAVSQQSKGGNGRIEWRQDSDRYEVSLSAPVTRQSWRLSGDLHSGAGRLEGLEGGTREGEDAEQLLREATGWEIPLQSLLHWARGMPDATYRTDEPAQMEFAADGRLRSLRQQDWRIDYQEWFEPEGERPAMPRRIEASRAGARVRLIVDQWNIGPP